MTAQLAANQSMSVEDYLAWEADRPVKHEYIGGMVDAMAGARNRHNSIASNTLVSLGAQLRGKGCKVSRSDTRVASAIAAE